MTVPIVQAIGEAVEWLAVDGGLVGWSRTAVTARRWSTTVPSSTAPSSIAVSTVAASPASASATAASGGLGAQRQLERLADGGDRERVEHGDGLGGRGLLGDAVGRPGTQLVLGDGRRRGRG